MLFGAFLASKGVISFYPAFLATTAGSVAGYMALFAIAFRYGRDAVHRFGARWFSDDSMNRAEVYLRRYGYVVILINRFLPGLRSVISIVSGYSRCLPIAVFILSAISAFGWNFGWMYSVYSLGGNWDTIKNKFLSLLSLYNRAVIIVLACLLVVVVIAFLLRLLYKKRRA